MMMRNIKLVLEYDGTRYHGWQSQAGSGMATVQETVERSISAITGEPAVTWSSGRTDAGVHALGHVANFHTGHSLPFEAWMPALNAILPDDIRVVSSEAVPPDFHSRYSSSGKLYAYWILNREAPSALFRNYSWQVKRPLDLAGMRKAAGALVGTHDFSSFRGSGCTARTTTRTLHAIKLGRQGDFVVIWFKADAFLKHMARNMAGTLVEAGLGRFDANCVAAILSSRDRTQAGRTAPPQGLCLVKVYYPDILTSVHSQK